jgi:hypothetical protein
VNILRNAQSVQVEAVTASFDLTHLKECFELTLTQEQDFTPSHSFTGLGNMNGYAFPRYIFASRLFAYFMQFEF